MAARRSTPGCESQLLAELTSRPGTLAPWSRAKTPDDAVRRRLPGQVESPPGETPWPPAEYRNDGRSGRSDDVVDRDDLRDRQARIGAGCSASASPVSA